MFLSRPYCSSILTSDTVFFSRIGRERMGECEKHWTDKGIVVTPRIALDGLFVCRNVVDVQVWVNVIQPASKLWQTGLRELGLVT